ncbi:hypothetical protein F442_21208 [Phytophthora nicotianae P10297]|uniref:Uncharacterized protein n=5 Tax=Phytophthora nicotianae TaxID=4792 RepID=V9DYD2_PHYNI|nr:hypothetical protein PPTG_21822 [Phytophthora nicotianae INRA-310]ETI31688.1 hypothetical protein F443_21371 [Phytophthora nicotianae P1569]ETM31982.1 hypothetical protein L914_20527 [Phytophthora nicotianae]ETO60403.1 hypothetical protein F444_21391 [Phytophthora nicotianae P1976]ETP29670.1 hypothetical protein F442_21208 [Phytophthora nicotianae P10297]ETI31696.1 hypothetical protein F443_21368 [Phytophthora nicotianae P1569]
MTQVEQLLDDQHAVQENESSMVVIDERAADDIKIL